MSNVCLAKAEASLENSLATNVIKLRCKLKFRETDFGLWPTLPRCYSHPWLKALNPRHTTIYDSRFTIQGLSGLRVRLVVNLDQFFHRDVSVDLSG